MNQFKISQLDYRYLLVDTYKSMNLSENDLACLLVVDNILRESPTLVTSDLLALKMNLDVHELDSILVSLINRGYLAYENLEGTNTLVTSLKPTYDRIKENFVRELVVSDHIESNKEKKAEITNVYGTFEKELGRTLSPVELETIREWVGQGISEEVIFDALHEVMGKSKKVSIRSVDKAIVRRLSSKDMEKEGYSAVNEKWKQDIEETIDIANTKWTDD